jgi:3-phosphoshikimate 1-carboxyvinyltransferase
MRDPVVIQPARRVEGAVSLPGDKSISHRAALVSILAEGSTAILGLSPADDVAASLRAAAAFGVRVRPQPQVESHGTGPEGLECHILEVHPPDPDTSDLRRRIDVGNSGTTIRIGLGICASIDGETYLDGDESINRRPMLRVVKPLRQMGANIAGRDGGEHTPLVVRGAPLHGVAHDLPFSSAQVKSALIFAGLRAEGPTTIREPELSRDHTERMLKSLGASIDISTEGLVVQATVLQGGTIDVPADISAAAAFMTAAALMPGSAVTFRRLGVNPTRTGFLDLLRAFGAHVDLADEVEISGEPRATVTVRAGDRRALEVNGALTLRAIDELPLVAVLGAFAEGKTVVTDAAELRVKETDRIGVTVEGLRALGVDIEAHPDGFVVHGRPEAASVEQVTLDPRGDHRMAMAFAVAALAGRGSVAIEDPGCVAVSHPTFFQDLSAVTVP